MDGTAATAAMRAAGYTHVVWVPDSVLGTWDAALVAAAVPRLIRATREGEAIGIAAGLLLGGAAPLVVIQCTGLFEAGDALRNVVHDLGLPLHLVIGVRGLRARRAGQGRDNCSDFTEPILAAWKLPFTELPDPPTAAAFEAALNALRANGRAGVVLLVE